MPCESCEELRKAHPGAVCGECAKTIGFLSEKCEELNRWLAAAREGQAGAILVQDSTLRDCKRLLGELSAATTRADALEKWLVKNAAHAPGCQAGLWDADAAEPMSCSCGLDALLARKALLPSEGKVCPSCGESPPTPITGYAPLACPGHDHYPTTPAPEGFEEWHRRECPGRSHDGASTCGPCEMPECKGRGSHVWSGFKGTRFSGRTCKEVYESERPKVDADSKMDLDDCVAGHPVALKELAELRSPEALARAIVATYQEALALDEKPANMSDYLWGHIKAFALKGKP